MWQRVSVHFRSKAVSVGRPSLGVLILKECNSDSVGIMKKPSLSKDVKRVNTFTYFAGYSNTVDSVEAVLRPGKKCKCLMVV